MLRVCIADDHELLRLGIRTALDTIDDIELVGEAHSGEGVLELVDELAPDVVLVDIRMPGLDGLTCLRIIRERHPLVKVVMLSASEHPGDISAALNGGASAYLSKRVQPKDLASALRQVVGDAIPAQAPVVAVSAEANGHEAAPLTVREQTLLDALSRGLSTKAISSELWISEKTVKFHLTNIYRKLGVHNRTSAMRYAFEHSLLSPLPAQAEQAAGRI
jgi:DNA-binding NarL/FixJ family response regulator